MALTGNALLANLTALKVYLAIEAVDESWNTLLESIVQSLSTKFDRELGCQWVKKTYTAQKVSGSGKRLLYLPAWPIVQLTTVKEDGITLTENTDFVAHADLGVLERISLVPSSTGAEPAWSTDTPLNIEVTFDAGRLVADIPADIVLALFKQVALEWMEAKTSSWGQTSRSFPDGSVTRYERKDLLPEVEEAIGSYRRPRI